MYIGKKKIPEIWPDLFVDGWKMIEVTEVETGEEVLEEAHIGLNKMDEVNEEKYLGDIISHDGSLGFIT